MKKKAGLWDVGCGVPDLVRYLSSEIRDSSTLFYNCFPPH